MQGQVDLLAAVALSGSSARHLAGLSRPRRQGRVDPLAACALSVSRDSQPHMVGLIQVSWPLERKHGTI